MRTGLGFQVRYGYANGGSVTCIVVVPDALSTEEAKQYAKRVIEDEEPTGRVVYEVIELNQYVYFPK